MKDLFSIYPTRLTGRNLIRLVTVMGLVMVVFFAQAQRFGAVTTFASGAGSMPQAIALGDVNGDKLTDIVTANFGSNTVGVLLGQAGGTFGAVTTYSVGAGSTPQGVVLGDVNGDGRMDIITANTGSNTVGVLLGQALGFGPVTTYNAGASSALIAVALGDVNGDKQLDIVTANSGSSTVGVLLGLATGGFGAVTTFSTGMASNPYAVALGDVNGDGQVDIVTANADVNTVGVLLGQAGGFGAVTQYPAGAGGTPQGVVLGDLNGDNILDIVTANNYSNTIGVLFGQAKGGFGLVKTYDTGADTAPNGLTLGDINGDGWLDIVTANSSNTAGVLLAVAGVFSAPTQYATGAGSEPNGVALGDVNGDGLLDIITANNGSGTAGVLLSQRVPAPTITSFTPTTGGPGTIVTMTGTDFTGATAVRIGTFAVTTFTVVSASTLTVVVPAGTGTTTGRIAVVTPGGTAISATPFNVVSAALAGRALPGLMLYPNPFHDRLTVALPTPGAAKVALRDLAGRLVLPLASLPADQQLRLPAPLAQGVYLLEVQQGGVRAVRRVEKQ